MLRGCVPFVPVLNLFTLHALPMLRHREGIFYCTEIARVQLFIQSVLLDLYVFLSKSAYNMQVEGEAI